MSNPIKHEPTWDRGQKYNESRIRGRNSITQLRTWLHVEFWSGDEPYIDKCWIILEKFDVNLRGVKLTRVTCQGAKLLNAISNDCMTHFGQELNIISMSVELCLRNPKFYTSGGWNWRRWRFRGRNFLTRFRTISNDCKPYFGRGIDLISMSIKFF